MKEIKNHCGGNQSIHHVHGNWTLITTAFREFFSDQDPDAEIAKAATQRGLQKVQGEETTARAQHINVVRPETSHSTFFLKVMLHLAPPPRQSHPFRPEFNR
jgi:hypothetical protein